MSPPRSPAAAAHRRARSFVALAAVDADWRRARIVALAGQGWSQRRIAAELGCSLATVNRIVNANLKQIQALKSVSRGTGPAPESLGDVLARVRAALAGDRA